MPDNEYYKDAELPTMVDKLNGLYAPELSWGTTCARKEHRDCFGDTIPRGEEYYSRHGIAFPDVTRLSKRSMERLLHALFHLNTQLEAFGEANHREYWDKWSKKMQNTHFDGTPVVEAIAPPAPCDQG